MAAIVATAEVSSTPQEAFDYVTDPSRFSEWQEGVVDGHMECDGPLKVGDRCLTTRRIGGAERLVTSEVTHVDPPLAWGVRGVDGPIRATVDVSVAPVGDERRGARVTIGLEFAGHGIGKVLVPLLIRPSARKEMNANMRKLKERLDGGP
jgi:hypothetical protein